MPQKFIQRLTLGIACVALFAAAGGPSYAAKKVKKISGSSIKTNSISANRLTASARASLKGNAGPAGAAGAAGATGATGPAGAAGAAGAKGTAIAFATISSGGTVIPDQSSGVTDAMVDRDAAGTYCFSSLPTGTKNIIVTANSIGLTNTAADHIAMVGFALSGSPNWSGCSAASDIARVTTFDASAAALADTQFQVWFEG